MAILAKIMDVLFHGEPDPKTLAKGSATPAPAPVNVEQTLTKLGEQTGATDWRHSIVDLMKCFGYDASLDNRIELAKELGYPKSINLDDTAEMNMWLHRELMKKITEHGGELKL